VKEMNKKTVCACAYALAFGVYNIVFVSLIFFFLFFFLFVSVFLSTLYIFITRIYFLFFPDFFQI
jgi:hypothetical protein